MEERVFIRMLELNGPSHFSLKDSRFHVKKAKESTGRVNTWREMDLMNTFTVEVGLVSSLLVSSRLHSSFLTVGFARGSAV
jgi:hypothetical protein